MGVLRKSYLCQMKKHLKLCKEKVKQKVKGKIKKGKACPKHK